MTICEHCKQEIKEDDYWYYEIKPPTINTKDSAPIEYIYYHEDCAIRIGLVSRRNKNG